MPLLQVSHDEPAGLSGIAFGEHRLERAFVERHDSIEVRRLHGESLQPGFSGTQTVLRHNIADGADGDAELGRDFSIAAAGVQQLCHAGNCCLIPAIALIDLLNAKPPPHGHDGIAGRTQHFADLAGIVPLCGEFSDLLHAGLCPYRRCMSFCCHGMPHLLIGYGVLI